MTNVTCPGGSDGSITITATGGAMPYTYQWTTSIANNNNTQGGFAAGTYVVTITDHAGCITTVSATISQPPAFSDVISTTPTTCGLNNGAAQITESGGTPNYTYNWSNALGTSNSISNVAAGSYTLTVTDASNCTVAVPVTITAIAPPVLTLTGTTNVSCNGGSDGTVTVSVTAGTAPYTYSWSNTTTTSSNTQGGFAAGIYIITVTDANNCSATVSATINQPQPLTAVPAVTNVTCPAGSNGAIALAVNGGTGQYTFQWTNTAQATQNINGLSANTYTVTVTDANGCQKDTFATVAAPPAFSTTSKIETPTNCSYDSTGTADIVIGGGTPGYTYLWSNGNTTTHLTGLAARTYHLTVTDANGCQYFDSVIISAPPAIVLTTTATAVSCHNGADGTASISALGGDPGFSYVWNVDSTTMSISNESAGTYTVTATDQHQCTASATAVIGNPDSLTITPTVIPQSCANQIDGSVSLQVSGGTPAYSYQWSPTGGSTSTLSSLSAGAYSYTVTDSHGCTATGSSTVALSSAIIPNATATDPLCPPLNNGNIIVNPAGGNPGYNYNWSNSSQNAINSQLGQGVYYLTITDSRGCTQQDTFTLAYTNQLSVDAGQDQTIDLGQSATLTAVTTGGSDISYIWSADYNLSCVACASTEAAPFETFTYTVNVTDTSGCKASDSVTVFVNKTYQLYVPNAFTPNGDGINDYFEIFGNKASWKYVGVMIFDRWGEKVFESTDINFQWDGRFKGALQEPDVFVYVLTVTFIDGYTIRGQKGSITLIR
jgi:gliding motility-associated-like protein